MMQARKLATIMSIDVAGYSRAVERDETTAVEDVYKLKHVVTEIAGLNSGRLFNTAGDGLMLEFSSASAGLTAAQQLLKRPDLPPLRVGLHLGEVLVEGDDLLGHGVNVAARLQQMSDPGVAIVSQTMRAQAHPNEGFRLVPCGRIRLAKMAETINVFALAPSEHNLSPRLRWAQFRGVALVGGVAAAMLLATAVTLGARVLQPTAYSIGPVDLIIRSTDVEVYPEVSPDSRFLVYAASTAGNERLDLYLRSTTGGDPIRLTETPQYDELAAAWSPGGDRIAYVRGQGLSLVAAAEPCFIVIRVIPDGEEREVGRCESGLTTRLSWHPTEEHLLFADRSSPEAPSRLRELDISSGVISDIFTGRQTGNDFNASYSPDDRRIVFIRYPLGSFASASVMVYERNNRAPRSLTNRTMSQAFVAWAPDGKSVFVAANLSDTGLNTDLWRLRADGRSEPVRLGLPYAWRLSQANGLLAFEIRRRNLNVVRLAADGRETLVTTGEQLDFEPDFSEDGTIAFTSALNGTWLMVQRNGEPLRRVALTDVTAPRGLRWAPDGQRVAIIGEVDGQARIFITEISSGRTRALLTPGVSPANVDWSNDGLSVVFGATDEGGARLWRMQLREGANAQPISDYGWIGVIESPEGLFGAPTGNGALAAGIYRLGGGEPRRLTPEVSMMGGAALASTALGLRGWTIRQGVLYYLYASDPATTTLFARPLSGGAVAANHIAPGLVAGLTIDPITGDAAFRRLTATDADIGIVQVRSE